MAFGHFLWLAANLPAGRQVTRIIVNNTKDGLFYKCETLPKDLQLKNVWEVKT